MNRWTIYCSEAQTRKALKLGATLKELIYSKDFENVEYGIVEEIYYTLRHYEVPTAEQMRGWLEGQGIYIIVPIPLIKDFNKKDFSKADAFEYRIVINGSELFSGEYLSAKEATLAAIDAVLDYLSNK